MSNSLSLRRMVATLAAGILVLSAPAAHAQRVAVKPQSVALATSGNGQLATGNPAFAIDLFETALAVDPRNVEAFVGLGKASEALGLPGKALGYYRRALTIDPNNIDALTAQAIGMAGKGKMAQAQANLDRMRKLCKSPCAAIGQVESAISKAQAKSAALRNGKPRA